MIAGMAGTISKWSSKDTIKTWSYCEKLKFNYRKKDECTMEDNGQFNNVSYNGRYNLKR